MARLGLGIVRRFYPHLFVLTRALRVLPSLLTGGHVKVAVDPWNCLCLFSARQVGFERDLAAKCYTFQNGDSDFEAV